VRVARVDAVASRPTEDQISASPAAERVGAAGGAEAVVAAAAEKIVTLPTSGQDVIAGSSVQSAPGVRWRDQAVVSSTTRRDDAVVGKRAAWRRNDRVVASGTVRDPDSSRRPSEVALLRLEPGPRSSSRPLRST